LSNDVERNTGVYCADNRVFSFKPVSVYIN